MANDGELLASIVREYFMKNDGRVKRDDLFDHFRNQLDKFDDQGTSKNRFGDIVNSLASLQNIEGEKYFVLKKSRNGTTPVLLRKTVRQVKTRKDKGVSLPASMRSFRFSAAEDAFGNVAIGDNKIRANSIARARAGLRSESSTNDHGGVRRNNSDTSLPENGQTNDSGVDTASETPGGSRQSSFSKNSEYDGVSQNSGDTSICYEDEYYEYDEPSHVLTPFEKSWMMSAMAGNKSEIICQLEEDPSIVSFKDFIMGYTALHWAAKQGNEELVVLLVEGGADVNMKSNGGFTPLHLATMYDKVNVIKILIDKYHANVHIRDHSGKEPKDVATKNVAEQLKEKLADPGTAMDSSSIGGLSKYMEQKDSPKQKAKLKGGSSFRFLRKQKKIRISRPMIEHWDSARQERLQSTLEGGEKELYKMQRSNSGSLFPMSFYAAKRINQSKSVDEKQATAVDDPAYEELGPSLEDKESKQRERLLSRSYPENEFRDLARISESDPQDSMGDHKDPLGSIDTSLAVVESDEKLVSDEVGGGPDGVLMEGSLKRKSYSENNLTFKDEMETRLTMDKIETDSNRPPSVFAEDTTGLVMASKNEDELTLRIDSEKTSGDAFHGKELATFMILPDKAGKFDTQKDRELGRVNGDVYDGEKSSGKATREVEERATFAPGVDARRDESFTEYTIPSELELQAKMKAKQGKDNERQQEQQHETQEQPVYHNDQTVPKLNNNYKQVSEILTTEEHKNSQVEEPTSPVRPPRRKDKKQKKAAEIEQEKKNVFDFDNGSALRLSNVNSKEDFEGKSTSYVTDKGLTSTLNDKSAKVSVPRESWRGKDDVSPRAVHKNKEMLLLHRRSQSANSLNVVQADEKQQLNTANYPRQKFQGALGQQGDLSGELTRGYSNPDYVKRTSDGFVGRRTESDENIAETRRKSEGFYKGVHQSSQFLKPNPEHIRRKSDGYTDQRRTEISSDQRSSHGFAVQKERSLDHPRRRSLQNPPPRENQARHVLPEALLDTCRRRASVEARGDPTPVRISQDDFGGNTLGDQRVPPPYRPASNEARGDLTPMRKSQGGDERVLPPYRPAPSETRADLTPVRKSGGGLGGDQRVPPPYRPPLGLRKDTPSQDGIRPTRPNHMPPPPPISTGPTPNRKSQEFLPEYQSVIPESRQVPPPPRSDLPVPSWPTERPYHSPHEPSKSSRPSLDFAPPTISPTAPPRRRRGSKPRTEDLDYPPPEVTPVAPPRKHRGSVRRSSSDDEPTTRGHTPRPTYPPPSLPTYAPPRPKSLEGENYTREREVSLDHPQRRSLNYEHDDTDIIVASSYNPPNIEAQSSNYRQSEANDYYPSSSFRHTSTEFTPPYPSESSFAYQPQSSPSNQSPSFKRRSAVDTTTRDQPPPDEILLARSITSGGFPNTPERFPDYPGDARREAPDYHQTRNPSQSIGERHNFDRRNGSFPQGNGIRYENDFDAVLVPKYDGYTSGRREPDFAMATEPEYIVAKQMPARAGVTEARPVMRGSREDMDTVANEGMKKKVSPAPSAGSNDSNEGRNKYRMTSMI